MRPDDRGSLVFVESFFSMNSKVSTATRHNDNRDLMTN